MSQLSFLHTAAVHVQSFDALLRACRPQVEARHLVRSELLARARAEGVDAPGVQETVAKAVGEAADGARVVLCTCSTIGGLAERAGAKHTARVLRVDRPMAEAALDLGSHVVVAAALASTVAPTEVLIREVARERAQAVHVETLLVEEAWPRFEAGDWSSYHGLIAAAIERVEKADVVVLAQASMAGARDTLAAGSLPVLASPELGLHGALAILDGADPQQPA